jgi:hypothetical protein
MLCNQSCKDEHFSVNTWILVAFALYVFITSALWTKFISCPNVFVSRVDVTLFQQHANVVTD